MADVTVVIPVYNGAEYLERSLETVFEQNIDGLEVIVVDDGSEDNSGEIAERMFSKKAREGVSTKLIRQENMGGSGARNTGLLHATGKYVLFFDSDDLMNEGLLKKLHRKALKTQADIVVCGLDKSDKAGRVIKPYEDSYGYFEGSIEGRTAALMMLRSRIKVWISNAMYRTTFLRKHSLKFTLGCQCIQDGEFVFKALFLADKVSSVNESLVRYVLREGSQSRQIGMSMFHAVGSMKRVRSFFEKLDAPVNFIALMDTVWIPAAYVRALYACQIGDLTKKQMRRLLRNQVIRKALTNYSPGSRVSWRRLFFLKNFPGMYFRYRALRMKKKRLHL